MMEKMFAGVVLKTSAGLKDRVSYRGRGRVLAKLIDWLCFTSFQSFGGLTKLIN
jgi:hypothetical protein